MRCAFVLRLGWATQARPREFEGWIEEVDTGRELRFRSTEELLAFLSDCFDVAERRRTQSEERDADG
jgi:hypothetical protein